MSSVHSPSSVAFAILERDRATTALVVRESDVELAAGPVLHALQAEHHSLLIPLSPDNVRVTDEGSVNVVIRPTALRDRGSDELEDYLVVDCATPQLFSTFESLCDEILAELRRAGEGVEPANICVDVLERWRALIGPSRDRLLSREELVGMLAELHLLEHLVQRTGATAGMAAWASAHEGARHDFRVDQVAVEVKATTGTGRFVVAIHGLRQLEPPDDGVLFIYAEQLEPVAGGEDSVPDCVDRLVLAGVSRLALLDGLMIRGYRVTDEGNYRNVRFTKLASRAGAVDGSFPALVPGALRNPMLAGRLENVRYSVDLGGMTDADPGGPTLAAILDALEGTS